MIALAVIGTATATLAAARLYVWWYTPNAPTSIDEDYEMVQIPRHTALLNEIRANPRDRILAVRRRVDAGRLTVDAVRNRVDAALSLVEEIKKFRRTALRPTVCVKYKAEAPLLDALARRIEAIRKANESDEE